MHIDEVAENLGVRAFEQNIVKESFQQEDFEREISSVKASVPSLSLL